MNLIYFKIKFIMESKINKILRNCDRYQINAFNIAYEKYKKKSYWIYRSREEGDYKLYNFCLKQIPEFNETDISWLEELDEIKNVHHKTIETWNYKPTIKEERFDILNKVLLIYWSNFSYRRQNWNELISLNKLFDKIRVCDKGILINVLDNNRIYGFEEYAALTGDNIYINKEIQYEHYDNWLKETYINGKPTYYSYYKKLKILLYFQLNEICKSNNDWNYIILDYLR